MIEWFKIEKIKKKLFSNYLNLNIVILILLVYSYLNKTYLLLFCYILITLYRVVLKQPYKGLLKYPSYNNILSFLKNNIKYYYIIGGLILTHLLYNNILFKKDIIYVLKDIFSNFYYYFKYMNIFIIITIIFIVIVLKFDKNWFLFNKYHNNFFFKSFFKRFIICIIACVYTYFNVFKINPILFFIKKKRNKVKFILINLIFTHFFFQKILFNFFTLKKLFLIKIKSFIIKTFFIKFFLDNFFIKKRASSLKRLFKLYFRIYRHLFKIHLNFVLVVPIIFFIQKFLLYYIL
jgi:hypothetical protein